MDSTRLVLVGDGNAVLDPKLDRGRGASWCEGDRSLVDLINDFGLVDRYRVDHPGGKCGRGLLAGLVTRWLEEPT